MRKFVKAMALAVLIVGLAGGLYVGNLIYTEFMTAPWDVVLGVNDDSRDMSVIKAAESKYRWKEVFITAPDGTRLAGTYVPAARDLHKMVIIFHGIYHNRGMSLTYVPMYRKLGYNVLLVDHRGFGESGGRGTTWGTNEIGDINAWVTWLRTKDAQVKIGMHGVSLGAAMELLYAQTDGGHTIAFYVADSSYGNIMSMATGKLESIRFESPLIKGVKIITPFVEAATWFHTGHVLDYYDPGVAVKHMTSPVLFIHGADDTLVPPEEARALYAACTSQKKEIYFARGASHAMAYQTDAGEYEQKVYQFLGEHPSSGSRKK